MKSANPIEAFALESFLNLYKQQENLLYSPYSAYLALALCASDALEETQSELLHALHEDQDMDTLIKELAEGMKSMNGEEIQIANSLWYHDDITLGNYLKDTACTALAAEQYQKNFFTDDIKNLVRDWISEKTKGTLSPALPIEKGTRMIYINALYFKDTWSKVFYQEHTVKAHFYPANGDPYETNFMHQFYQRLHGVDNEVYTATSLSFKKGASMLLYLPKDGHDVLDIVKDDAWLRQFKNGNLENYSIELSVPSFQFSQSIGLKDTMKLLGIHKAFDPKQATFASKSSTTLSISQILQGTYISLNEAGVEASAFTEISIDAACAPPQKAITLTLNRPFLYVITAKQGVPLLIGYMQHPVNLST